MFVIIYYTGITAISSAIINVINIIYIFLNNLLFIMLPIISSLFKFLDTACCLETFSTQY